MKKGAAGLKSGQAMIEFTLVAVMLVALFSVMALLHYAVKRQSERTVELVSSEYP